MDAVLAGAGRQPNVEGLGLEAAGVTYDPRKGVTVDDHLRTSNRRIFAAGDVCSRFQFTHAADAMARIVLKNALFLGRARASALTIPWCTYTSPELAQCGLTEAQAREQGVPVQVLIQEFATSIARFSTARRRGSSRFWCAPAAIASSGPPLWRPTLAN